MFWLWLLLYGLLFAVPRALMPAAAPLLTPALLAVYWAVLLRGLHTRGRLRSYGLCRGRGLTARDALLSLPVLLFAALNIAFGGARLGIAEAVYLLFAVFGEEVLFRGVLPAVWGEKLGAGGAAAASARSLRFCIWAAHWRECFRRRGAGAVRLRRGAAADGGARKDRQHRAAAARPRAHQSHGQRRGIRRASGRGLSGGVGAVHAVRAAAAQGCSLNSERNRNNRRRTDPG